MLLQVLVRQWASQPDGSNEGAREFKSEGVELEKFINGILLNGLGTSTYLTTSVYLICTSILFTSCLQFCCVS